MAPGLILKSFESPPSLCQDEEEEAVKGQVPDQSKEPKGQERQEPSQPRRSSSSSSEEEAPQEQPYEEKEADPSDPIRFASAIDPSLVSSKDDLGQEKVHGPQDQKGPEQPESSGSASNSNEVKAAARGQDHASALEEGKVPAPVPSPTSPVPTDPMDNQR